MIYTPRDYQRQASDAVFYYLRDMPGNCVVVMPTGTGKSFVIADFVHRLLTFYPTVRVAMLTHVKTLIEQNAEKLLLLWPQAPLGIHSAGLRRRDLYHPVIYGGIGTFANIPDKDLPRVDVLTIDECHLISPADDTQYRKLIERLKGLNPNLRVVGLTATNYRAGQGLLTEGDNKLFDGVAIDMSSMEWFAWFIAHGYLVPPIPRRTDTTYNMADVAVTNGDYAAGQMNAAVDTDDLNTRICREMVAGSQGRYQWAVFAAGIEHSDHIAERLQALGVGAYAIHSRVPVARRDELMTAWKSQKIQCLVSNNMLTTGVDNPFVDYMPICRPTTSASLWVQMLGRGTRPCVELGKVNCLCPDFAGNAARLGPINDPRIPKPKGKTPGEAPVKICEHCGCYCHASARICEFCGEPFDIRPKILALPSITELYRGDLPKIETFNVGRVFYMIHETKRGPNAGNILLRVNYHCGSKQFHEFFDFQSRTSYGMHMAHDFWRRTVGEDVPQTNTEALAILTRSRDNHIPARIRVHVNLTYPKIVSYEY